MFYGIAYIMLKIQRPLCPDLTFRLTHDISPDSLPDDEDDIDSELLKEQFILNCLSQAKQRQDSFSDRVKEKQIHEIERISEKLSPFEIKQKTLEQLNNVINVQYHGKTDSGSRNIDLNIYNNVNTESKYSQEEKPDDQSHFTFPAQNRSTSPICSSNSDSKPNETKTPRRPRKLPEIPKKHALSRSSSNTNIVNEKCLAEELQEALTQDVPVVEDDDDNVFLPNTPCQAQKGKSNKVYPKFSGRFLEELKNLQFNAVSKNTRPYLNSDNIYLEEDSTNDKQHLAIPTMSGNGRRDSNSDGEGSRRKSSSSFPATNFQDLEVTHRGMHRFIPRHKDEIAIEIGDPVHVFKLADDLWCEGVNLRTGKQGVFPSMYATDLDFLEEDTETDQDGCSKFNLRFLGSVEVNYHKGDDVLVQAINKVALTRRSAKCSTAPPICNVEISQYGIRMLDKSKVGHESDAFTHFFALKNISFCGYHPRNERYFAFITKHPKEYRFACHVFLGERSTRTVSEALGNAFKRFYQEYMAFTHQTEDIYIE
ncbi:hypothetical protein KUTeg_007837 [Tegillarca granosa]|uniref:JNK-interacting protein 1 n=1 Tax=Tegillarca granosa TaxID=220873 RepID=A0ABQ9FID7_TEGGR|nr:hypothetical protein KUTeg_007837 [Tegillarca granosa]